ncbi:lipoprotein/autotransporter domain-containing protein [Escherichia coli]|uniref:Lipoprotein/autotransporter domain-containing protein n=1 Tax=Escherichia coli TaxID=562 RepID=A0A377E547_ECOLX|nr:lipoprotein/autotransporter domain-containing protein [Escherichia coli]
MLALSGSASGASLEVDNDQITNIDTDVLMMPTWLAGMALECLIFWLANASLTTITTSVIGWVMENSKGTVNVLGGTWRLYDSEIMQGL